MGIVKNNSKKMHFSILQNNLKSIYVPRPSYQQVRVQTVDVNTPKGYDYWNKTYYPKLRDTASNAKPWYVIDAEGQTLGRLATLAASVIRGKLSRQYHPAMDMGCYVIVVNAEKVKLTGNKFWKKYYFR